MQRKGNSEFAACAGGAVHRNVATMGLSNMLHQRKSQPAPLGVVNQGITNAIELLENLVLFGGRYANTMINYFQFDASVFTIKFDCDVLALF